MLANLAGDAIRNLNLNRTRSILALSGIAMGTAAVIGILLIGLAAKTEALRRFDDVGADFLTIVITSVPGLSASPPLSESEVQSLHAADLGLAVTAPMIRGEANVTDGRMRWMAEIVGTTPKLASLMRLGLREGRFVSSLDGYAPFAVIGSDVDRQLAQSRRRPTSIGDTIELNADVFKITGILSPHGLNPLDGLDVNTSIFVNMKAVARLTMRPAISNIAARLVPSSDGHLIGEWLRDYFATRHKDLTASVVLASSLIDNVKAQMKIYDVLVVAIGAVAMAIGGVGIMNVMLMAVIERREEIGLRMAVGASPARIRAMFVIESSLLAAFGSVAGVLLGTVVGWGCAHQAGWPFAFSFVALPLGLGMAIVVGLFFGIYPAHRAASLDPIRALRRE